VWIPVSQRAVYLFIQVSSFLNGSIRKPFLGLKQGYLNKELPSTFQMIGNSTDVTALTLPIIPKRLLRNWGVLETEAGRGNTMQSRVHTIHGVFVGMAALCAMVSGTPSAVAQELNSEQQYVIPIAEQSPQSVNERLSVETVKKGTSSRWTRRSAIKEIPLQQMTPENRAQVTRVLDDISLYRRLPTVRVESDPRVYQFFTQHPDVAVSMWRAMNISRVKMWKTADDKYETDTQEGTAGSVKVLLRDPQHYIISCSGQFTSPATKNPIRAVAVMHLQPQNVGNNVIEHKVDLYVSFPSQTVETIARLISPVSNRIADRNFEEVSLFVEMMHQAMSKQPGWIEQLTTKMDGIEEGRTDELLQLTANVFVDYQKQVQRGQSPVGTKVSYRPIVPPTKATK